MSALRIAAPAKLNLFLHVTGRREGFHLLDSLVAFSDFGDVLELEADHKLSLEIQGPFANALKDESGNLVLKIAEGLQRLAGNKTGAHMVLHKHIPIGSGVGGGSTDAAAALRGLVSLWNLEVKEQVLYSLAAQMGSDVPVCLSSHSSWMSGVGEQLEKVTLPDFALLLVNPGGKLPTPQVFKGFSGRFDTPVARPDFPSLPALVEFLQKQHNSLEAPALALMPAIGDVLAALRATKDCLLARMSGSGGSCFGIYENKSAAQQAQQQLKQNHPDWWCVATGLYGR